MKINYCHHCKKHLNSSSAKYLKDIPFSSHKDFYSCKNHFEGYLHNDDVTHVNIYYSKIVIQICSNMKNVYIYNENFDTTLGSFDLNVIQPIINLPKAQALSKLKTLLNFQ